METVGEFLDKLASKGVKLSVQAGRLNCYAQRGALTNELKDGIIRFKLELVSLLEGRERRREAHSGESPSRESREFPLSAGQQGLYILQKLHPEMSAYNVPLCFKVNADINVVVMAKAWDHVLEQFPILSARVVDRDGVLYQRLDDGCKTTIQQQAVDFADDEELLSFLQKRAKQPFDLNRGPLTRIELFIRDKQKPILLITVHHIVFDGASAVIVLRSLLEFYQQLADGKPVRLSHQLPGYQEFVEWEKAMLASEEGAAHARYWQQQLDGELPAVELTPDVPRQASTSFEGKTLVEDLPEDLCRSVREFSKAHSLPPSVIFLAMFQLLLHRYTNQDEIIVGMPVMGRAAHRFAAEVGYFINMVPLRTHCGEPIKLMDFLRKVHGTMLDALYHSGYPFPLMLDGVKSRRSDKSPIFRVSYAYQNFMKPSDFSSMLQRQTFQLENVAGIWQEGDFDLGLEIYEDQASSFSVHLKYNPDLYVQGTITGVFEHYCVLLKAVSESPNLFAHEYPILTEREKQKLLIDFNDTQTEYPGHQCLHELFIDQVARHSEDTAVVCGDERLTYQQLYERSHDLALYLQWLGVEPDCLVGVCMERSLDMVVGLLGILQAGGAYLPLDPDYPDERVAHMLRDSRAAFVLTEEKLRARLSMAMPADTRVIAVDRQRAEIGGRVAELKARNVSLQQQVRPHHLAYVIYTSGSTGQPKGVAIEHRSPVTLVHWATDVYSQEELAGVLASTSICFDLSVYEVFVTLANGGTIVLVRNALELVNVSNRETVTLINTVPSAMEELQRLGAIPDSVRTINLAGEPLSPTLVDKIYNTTSVRKVYDLYGPTEDTTYSTYVLRAPHAPATIGRPIANTQVYILDQHGHPQPIGAPGELHIAGDGLARGYLNRPELTQQKFIPSPFAPGARMYKTGDLARWLDDGNIQYLGRIDTQVKIRGFRIEMAEVEAQLNPHPQVQDSAVIAQGEGANRQLVAFYRAKDTTADHLVQLPTEELRAHLMRTLPDYMVPAVYVSLGAIPLNPNGKVDRRALAAMDVTIASGQEYVGPRNDTEQRLVAIWAEVLNLAPEKIGVNDNFFERGGHSLLATQLISKIRRQLDVEVPLKAVFEQTSVAQLAEFVARAQRSDIPPIRPVDRAQFDRLPLSFAQERLWFINQLEPESAGYNLPGAVILHDELDVEQLEQGFNLIIARHENLRTLFPSQDGLAQQRILDRVDFKLDRIDLSHEESKQARDSRAREICRTDAATPFDLANGPLIRGKAIKLAEHEHILVLNMHHIVSDGWSIGVLIKELGLVMDAFRSGRRPELEPLPIQYVDYSVWQRNWLEESGVLKKQLAYWQEKLADVPESLDLATDYPRPSVQSLAGATQTFVLDAPLTGQLNRLAKQQGSTLYMVLLAAFKVLLYRYTGQTDICVGSPIANRQYGETKGLIGMFVNTLVLRSRIEGEDTFAALLSKVKATCLEAYEHQDAPFEKVVDVVRAQRNMAISPLFQVMVILQNADMGALDPSIELYPLDSGISKFDLTVEFTETPEGLAGSIEYSTALYKPQTIARMVEHFTALCRAITAAPTTRIRELDYIGEAEMHRLLVDYNLTGAKYPKDKCLHELFVDQVARHSEDTAVVSGDERLTYQQLYERSHDLALYLQWLGVEPDCLVGVCMERSLDMVVGLLGILQAGGAYVPLDPNYPDERVAHMLRDSRAAFVLTEEKLQARLSVAMPADARVIAVDRQRAEIGGRVAELKARNVSLQQQVRPHHLAYVIYTSGSTGQPKGVAIEHRSPVTLVHWATDVYSQEELAGVLASTSICFDLSVYEVFVTLANGGTIVLVRNALELVNVSNRETVTLINTVPSAMEELQRLGAIPDSVRTINLAGEPLSPTLVDKIYNTTSVRKVYDLYGPTEDTTYSTYVLRAPHAPATIGRPIANTQVYILDQHGHPQPIGAPGELHIAGDGLARGYLNRPELTQQKFIPSPFAPGARMYKTGDLARWLDDGNIQYLGRIDTQVKIRGFRIEMAEVEAQLNPHPQVQDSAVIAQGEGANRQLVAFYRAKDTTADHLVQLPNEELRAHLMRTLPDYMVPAVFVSLAAIPLNPNGKVDRRALAAMDVTIASGQEYVGPRNDREQRLVAIWAEVLNLAPEKIGVNDNFFERGGHSLLATQLISKIRRQLDVEVPLKTVFEQTSVAQLAEFVARAQRSDIPPIRPVDRAQFDRLPLSFAQERLWFINQLEPESAGYNLPGAVILHDELDVEQLEQGFNLIIARHENLRTVFPSQDGLAQQRILDRLDFKLDRIDLSHDESKQARDSRAREICRTDAATPFDLANGPLIRGKAIKLAEHEHILTLNMHHIVSDGWSIGVLIKELGLVIDAFRNGRSPELAPLPIQYVDYSVWQRNWLEESGVLKKQLAYWQEKLADVPESLDLATDYPRPSVQSLAGATQTFVLDAPLTGQLNRLAKQQGSTLYMVLLAAFKVLLYRYTGQTDICVGSPIANRQYGETKGLIGMFVNTLVLRSRIEGEDTFAALLSKVKATCLEAYEHQDAPFEKVVDVVRAQRNMAISPLFQVMVILQNADMGALDPSIELYPLDSGISEFDLTVEFTETPEGLAGSIEYSTALYKSKTIASMVEHFTALCRAITATPTTKIRDLEYIGEAEMHRLLVDYNLTRSEYPKDKCLHQQFAEQAAIAPDNTAVVCGDEQLTYQQLYARSHDLALYLQSQGVKPDGLVGLCVERSLDMVVGLLGILQAGGAYVPLDPNYPDERLAYMLRDSQAAIVLTQEKLRGKLTALVTSDMQLIALDRWSEIDERVAMLKAAEVRLQQQVEPQHLAYVIYTSGSTGQPKGVMVSHGALVNHASYFSNRLCLSSTDRVMQFASLSFDTAAEEIFPTWLAGASLMLRADGPSPAPSVFLDIVEAGGVTVLDLPTAYWHELADQVAESPGRTLPPSVRAVVIGGEVASGRRYDTWRRVAGDTLFLNSYGPTEATIIATMYEPSEADVSYVALPIGRPIANVRAYVLDEQRQPAPVGIAGELYIGGDGVVRGYLHRPELTANRFIADPFCGEAGARMYRTGDRVRYRRDGVLEFLGRMDEQVKIRGFRIEPGEIEAALRQQSAVRDAVVLAQEDKRRDRRLVAYVVTQDGRTLQAGELRAALKVSLPEFMIPAAFVPLETMPRLPNGKLDRRALAAMDVTMASGQEYVGPRNDTEQRLVAIWAEVLNLAPEKIGVNDNFFERGGHSLLATQLISKIRRQLDVEVPLKAVFEQTSVAQLAEFVAKAQRSDIPPIRPVDRAQFDRLPLSFAQERLWFISQLEPESAGYNLPGAIILHDELDVDQLEEGFNLIIARHENLRTLFPSQDGLAQQRILDRVDFKLERIDLSHEESKQARDSRAREICRTDAATPFDLANGPLIRGKAIKLAEHEHILTLNMHHIVSDGWSIGVLIKELGLVMDAVRNGRRPELEPLPIQYVDYSVWQRNWLEESGVLKKQLAYWQEKLADVPESLDLATDYPRPSVQSLAGATQTFVLDAPLTGQLNRLAKQQGSTLYMVLLAAFKVLLHRYTGQTDICVGSPIANRQYGETKGLIGMFVNTLVLRSRIEGEDTFAALLSKVKATCLEAYEHQDAPFEKVVDVVRAQRNMAISPLFQVMVILQNADMGALDPSIELYPLDSGISKFDLTVEFTETPEGLAGSIEYSTALYKPQTIARMVEHFTALCRAITAAPTTRIRELDYIGEAEMHRLLVDYNLTGAKYPKDKCLHELFVDQVARHSEDTAVVSGDERLTYQQLYERSHDLALYLQWLGVEPDCLVGVCMERSLDMVVGLLGILQAGGAYVPLDPNYPDERVAHMLRDSRAAFVLTEEKLQTRLSVAMPADARVIAVDRQRAEIGGRVAELKARNVSLQQQVRPHHLAYVIYTSGSTGQPKGVAIEHRSPVTLVHWATDVYSQEELAGVLASTSICFDLSVYEVFVTLANGGTIVLVRNALELVNVSNRETVTLINTVPSAMEELQRLGAIPDSVQTINVAGEPLSPTLVDKIYNTTSVRKVYDLYGPTEDTTYSTYVLRAPHAPATIGRPIANTQVYILDQHGHPQPIGAPGELHIAGDGLARGYLNRPELTQQKFIPSPFAPGARMYKTGDLARWLDDGNIQYLGRIDTQVKIRGFRIEMAEVEAQLNPHPQVQDSAVIAQGEGANRQLIAFYRAKDTTADHLVQLPTEELRAHLMRTLPDYMVPAVFVSLAAIPLNPNGKVDRRALAAMDVTMASNQEYVGPRNDTEQRLVAIWAEVLNLAPEKIGVNDNFFERGGHSLSAVQLLAKTNRYFTQMLPLATLFAAPTIAGLAKLISSKEAPSFDILVPIQTKGHELPVFALPGVGGNVLSLQPLSGALGASQRIYGLQAVGLDGKTPPLSSVEETARANIAALKTLQPAGPYSLIGHSYGGLVAYEMARVLLEQGEDILSLILLDSLAPSVVQETSAGDEVAEFFDACIALADVYHIDLEIDIERFRQLSDEENIQHVRGLLSDRGLEINDDQFTAFYRVFRANLLCRRTYQPSMLSRKIDVSLYRALQAHQVGPAMPRDYGWNQLLQSPIRIYDVDATHLSILGKVSFRK